MGWLLELLFESVSEMCSKFIVDMMDVASGMFTEILSCDLDLFEELFGVAGDLYRNAIVPMGVALLLMILVWQLFKSMFGKLGTASEDPVELVFRSCFCLFMIMFAKDIVNYILEVAGTPYDWVVGTVITVDSFSEYVTAAEGVMSVLGIDVMTISILKLLLQLVVAWNYFKMLFILAERYVLLGIFSYTSPLAFAAGGSKATNNVLGSWTKMFGGQVLVVILDAWCVKMFLSAYGNMMASSYGFTKFFAANMCLIWFCKITAKLDSYMGSLGVNLGRISGGMSGLGALLMAGRLMNFGGGRKGAAQGEHGGHMNFGSGKTIPLGNGSQGFAGNGMTGGTGQPGGGIGGIGADGFGGKAPEFMGSGQKPEEGAGFGEFGGNMEPGEGAEPSFWCAGRGFCCVYGNGRRRDGFGKQRDGRWAFWFGYGCGGGHAGRYGIFWDGNGGGRYGAFWNGRWGCGVYGSEYGFRRYGTGRRWNPYGGYEWLGGLCWDG